ncbi:unnamed protein product [Lepeophtheirus salmonis]|uniref:(salmon louse) hypothetical protein n=1 Tax=Lepeophtheirus salmonis TaxID=72036 RepID=A0A7R8H769_LEPSM|nr:unnamed protein product [Lepeophtheirus salmonis]CAF2917600.1 unnamed protein product [Lepeophtheirus salmonis]
MLQASLTVKMTLFVSSLACEGNEGHVISNINEGIKENIENNSIHHTILKSESSNLITSKSTKTQGVDISKEESGGGRPERDNSSSILQVNKKREEKQQLEEAFGAYKNSKTK